MSGFVAIFNRDKEPVDRDLLQRLTSTLEFRGPDRQHFILDKAVGLGHALYKTTYESEYDVQPVNRDNLFLITSSARIDGREELINKLGISKDVQIERTPDYELILHAYLKWGENCVNHLIGDYALVLWDADKQQLFCARDHFGMGQLHYACIGNSIVISNSMYCLLQHPAISKRLNDQAIGDYLLLGDHTWFDKTMTSFADIKTLLPAHTLIINQHSLTTRQFWKFPLHTPLLNYQNSADYIEHFQHVFRMAVSDRLRYPKIVISMSGGMDSSSIAAIASDIQAKENQAIELNIITAVFDAIHPDQERFYSSLVAEKLGIPIHYIEGDHYPMFDIPEPTTRPLGMLQPGFWVEMNRRESIMGRVVFTAEAGDNILSFTPLLQMRWQEINLATLVFEIFKSYNKYSKFPSIGTGILAKLRKLKRQDGINAYPGYPSPGWINPEFEARMNLKERWSYMTNKKKYDLNSRHPSIHRSIVEPDWNRDDLCMYSDFALPEERDPFLDLRLLEFILSLPPFPWLFEKDILRQSMNGKLPKEIIERPKTVLGMIHSSLIKQAENQWIDTWNPLPELGQYIDHNRIPKLTGKNFVPDVSYTHLLPLSLNNWLLGLQGNNY